MKCSFKAAEGDVFNTECGEGSLACGECENDFCNEHLLFYDHPDRDRKFFCRRCCDLFDLERPSW